MILTIPIALADPSFVQETALDGRTYRLLFRWNSREGFWYLTLSDLDDVPIAASLKLVPGAALLRHVTDFDRRPPGELFMVGTPGRDTLGTEAVLTYLDAAEKEAIG